MAQLSIRIEEREKREATKTLRALGLDMSTAVKMFLSQVVKEQGLPFTPTRHKRTPAEIRAEWDEDREWSIKHGKRYTVENLHEIYDDVLKENN